jgi:hypothetical protein
MKVKVLALLVIAALPLMGFDCLNDPFYAAINITPISATFPVDAQSVTKSYGPIATAGYYNNSYSLTGVSVFDLKVSTKGPSLGTSSFTVQMRTSSSAAWQNVVTASGPWSDFNTPQSIFSSYFKTIDGPGLNNLIAAAFAGNRLYVQVVGNVASAPANATSNTLTVDLYIQATGSLSTKNN